MKKCTFSSGLMQGTEIADTSDQSNKSICDVLRDLVSFVEFKKREKQPWRSVALSKVAECSFTKSNSTPWVFFTFFNLYNWYQIAQSIIFNWNHFSSMFHFYYTPWKL